MEYMSFDCKTALNTSLSFVIVALVQLLWVQGFGAQRQQLSISIIPDAEYGVLFCWVRPLTVAIDTVPPAS